MRLDSFLMLELFNLCCCHQLMSKAKLVFVCGNEVILGSVSFHALVNLFMPFGRELQPQILIVSFVPHVLGEIN